MPTIPVSKGGTNLTATPTNGQIPIGNGSGYTLATLTAGTNITISNSAGGITINASSGAPTTAQVLSATAGLTAGAVGTYGFFMSVLNSVNGFGTTIGGSNLRPSNAGHVGEFNPQSGTWRCLGYVGGEGAAAMNSTMFVRIS